MRVWVRGGGRGGKVVSGGGAEVQSFLRVAMMFAGEGSNAFVGDVRFCRIVLSGI